MILAKLKQGRSKQNMLFFVCVLIFVASYSFLVYGLRNSSFTKKSYFSFIYFGVLLTISAVFFYRYWVEYPVGYLKKNYKSAADDFVLLFDKLFHVNNYYLSASIILFIASMLMLHAGWKRKQKEDEDESK